MDSVSFPLVGGERVGDPLKGKGGPGAKEKGCLVGRSKQQKPTPWESSRPRVDGETELWRERSVWGELLGSYWQHMRLQLQESADC